MQDLTINKSIVISAVPSKVWAVLIDPAMIRQYFPGAETITNWQTGTEIVFIHEYQGKVFKNKGIILDFDSNQLLRYTYWTAFSNTADLPQNYTTITYQLEATGDSTILTLTQTNFSNEEWYRSLVTGWDVVLAKIKEITEA